MAWIGGLTLRKFLVNILAVSNRRKLFRVKEILFGIFIVLGKGNWPGNLFDSRWSGKSDGKVAVRINFWFEGIIYFFNYSNGIRFNFYISWLKFKKLVEQKNKN